MAESDWDHVTVIRKSGASKQSNAKAVTSAQRSGGAVSTQAKGFSTGQQKGIGSQAAVLDRETEELSHKKVERKVAKIIMQGRQAKGWTQKELATKINEKPLVITEYEAGKGIPDPKILAKIERKIGFKLNGKNAGDPIGGGPKKK